MEDLSCLPMDSLTLPDWMSTLDGRGVQFYTQVIIRCKRHQLFKWFSTTSCIWWLRMRYHPFSVLHVGNRKHVYFFMSNISHKKPQESWTVQDCSPRVFLVTPLHLSNFMYCILKHVVFKLIVFHFYTNPYKKDLN